MALCRNLVVANNNRSNEMPFLQSFRQSNFDTAENHTETDVNLVVNGNLTLNHETILPKDSVDTNANVGIGMDDKTAASINEKSKINYDDMYFTNEEIPVMGYTSGDENSSLQLLETSEVENDQHLHKLMPLPSVGTTEADVFCPHLVINDLPSIATSAVSPPQNDVIDNFQFDPGRYQSELDRMWTSHAQPQLVGKYPTIHMDNHSSEIRPNTAANSSREMCRSESIKTHDSRYPSVNAHIVSRRSAIGAGNMELVKPSFDSRCRDDSVSVSENSCYSSELENAHLAHLGSGSVSGGECNSATNGGVCGKFMVDLDEPIHMTLEEVRSSLRSLNGYLKSAAAQSASLPTSPSESACLRHHKNHKLHGRRLNFGLCLKPRHTDETSERSFRGSYQDAEQSSGNEHIRVLSKSIKHTLCNWFGIAKCVPSGFQVRGHSSLDIHLSDQVDGGSSMAITHRALPPVPQLLNESGEDEVDHLEVIVQPDNEHDQSYDNEQPSMPLKGSTNEVMSDFASSIQKVKDCGWYWGPISGEMAEKILANEPDGSFILRDSSDEYYIFSLTFKLNGFVRHVRIEHEHGNFSFGTFTKFKSHTIVEFIENAVEHSRSGRYLFFIHRRPILGPVRVQLLHPVSRFKQVQSLQHICRFTILKVVRRDHIENLPIPKRLKDYLNTPHYYSEQMQDYQNIFNGGSSIQSTLSEENAITET